MTTYIVSHYNQNPRHNTTHKFTNYKDAQQEFAGVTSESDITGCSYLEVAGDKDSWKKRDWDKRKATIVRGRFARTR